MKAEIRADGARITGYVNVPGRESRPISDSRGKFIEVIEPGAFKRAISKATKISLLLDHDKKRVLADTNSKSLTVEEDNVGLRADTLIDDEEVVKAAREKRLKGWSFNMRRPKSYMEERAEGELPIRHVTDFEMDEITLVMNKVPCYSSTSVELRAGEEELTEYRALIDDVEVSELTIEKPKANYDNANFKERLKNL